MSYHEVQDIMANKYFSASDNIYKQTIPVFTHLYKAPVGASGHIEVWYSKRDSLVVNVQYSD